MLALKRESIFRNLSGPLELSKEELVSKILRIIFGCCFTWNDWLEFSQRTRSQEAMAAVTHNGTGTQGASTEKFYTLLS